MCDGSDPDLLVNGVDLQETRILDRIPGGRVLGSDRRNRVCVDSWLGRGTGGHGEGVRALGWGRSLGLGLAGLGRVLRHHRLDRDLWPDDGALLLPVSVDPRTLARGGLVHHFGKRDVLALSHVVPA